MLEPPAARSWGGGSPLQVLAGVAGICGNFRDFYLKQQAGFPFLSFLILLFFFPFIILFVLFNFIYFGSLLFGVGDELLLQTLAL